MPLKTHLDEAPSINLTPMIDVVFLLIIFFMVGTKFTELERKIALQVPQVADVKALTPAPERRVVNVYRDGRIALDRDFISMDQLIDTLSAARSEYADLGVLVRGDAEGPFQNVASVLGACRQAGISEMGISVRLAERKASNAVR
jgi:biopolymer transport protein ExbD